MLRLGALPFEKIEARRVILDLKWNGVLFADGIPAVDYSCVCDSLGKGLKSQYDYLEDLGGDILDILQNEWPGKWKVMVHKSFPPTDPPMERATVTLGE